MRKVFARGSCVISSYFPEEKPMSRFSLFFINIFINELPFYVSSQIDLYADDTTITDIQILGTYYNWNFYWTNL